MIDTTYLVCSGFGGYCGNKLFDDEPAFCQAPGCKHDVALCDCCAHECMLCGATFCEEHVITKSMFVPELGVEDERYTCQACEAKRIGVARNYQPATLQAAS